MFIHITNIFLSNDASKSCVEYFAGVVAIAKNEEDYLDEWINHYLQLGFTRIYLYDNNDKTNDKQYNICKHYPEVVYKDIRGYPNICSEYIHCKYLQDYVYNVAYTDNDCKYLLFVDIDEFLSTKQSLRDLIRFKKYIHIPWKIFTDNDLIYKDDRPVMERFTTPSNTLNENTLIKTLIQTGNNAKFMNAHYVTTDLQCYSPSGKPCNGNVFNELLYMTEDTCINHYITKSAEEYIHKISRGYFGPYKRELSYYFYVNKWSQEKEDYFKSQGFDKVK